MKSRFIAITTFVILLLAFSGCSEPGSSSYFVLAEYELSGGSQTATIVVLEGMTTPVIDAEVRVNGYLIDPFLFIYTDYNFITPALSPGDTVNVSVKVGGNEIMNDSVVVPAAPIIAAIGTPVDSTSALSVTWTGLTVDEYRVSMDYPDTVSEDGYTEYVSGSTFNHTIPANTMVPSNAFTEIYVSATNITMASGDSLSSASQLTAVNTDTVTVNTN